MLVSCVLVWICYKTKPDQIVTATIPNKSVNEFPTSIFLLNGGNSKGKIIERMAGDSLKLKNSFGSTFIYSFNEIDFIKTDKNGSQTRIYDSFRWLESL
jgi:hypothetical protein